VHVVDPRPGARRRPAGELEHRALPARFELRNEGGEANGDVLRFVSHTYEADLDTLTPRTTLERALVEHMRARGTWRAPTGVTSLR
jgi:hypothetical protein